MNSKCILHSLTGIALAKYGIVTVNSVEEVN